MEQKYHHYTKWEDYRNGMYDNFPDEELGIKIVIEFMSDINSFSCAMRRVIEEWVISCEQNLTDIGNRKAWIGQAACCIEKKIPENITRKAWGLLDHNIQELANSEANKHIKYWEEKNSIGYKQCLLEI